MGVYTEIYDQLEKIDDMRQYEKISTKKIIKRIEEIDFSKIEQPEKLKYFLNLFEKKKKITLFDKLNIFNSKKSEIVDLLYGMMQAIYCESYKERFQ